MSLARALLDRFSPLPSLLKAPRKLRSESDAICILGGPVRADPPVSRRPHAHHVSSARVYASRKRGVCYYLMQVWVDKALGGPRGLLACLSHFLIKPA